VFIENARIEERTTLKENIYLIKTFAPKIASNSHPGQFCNIKVSESSFPLLRRPFSICDVEEDYVSFMFQIFGEGTKILAEKSAGEYLDILGPLGHGFNVDGNFDTAIFVGGGIGMAPFPYLRREIGDDKRIRTFIGARSEKEIIDYGVVNNHYATDDGSQGFQGNVVQLLEQHLEELKKLNCKIFACGPTPMFKSLQKFTIENNIECEISTESAMACGFGICQGCPITIKDHDESYSLICKDGPVFDIRKVEL
jgi:dihydroorotate dehydrogenase electron transfer subunit